MDSDALWILIIAVVGFVGVLVWNSEFFDNVLLRWTNSHMSKDVAHQAVKELIDEINDSCPQQLQEGIILNRVYLKGKYYVYSFFVDHDVFSIEALREGGEAQANELKAGLIKEGEELTSALLKKAEYGIINEFIDQTSHEKYIVKIEHTELKT
jgi:hypothetical protein